MKFIDTIRSAARGLLVGGALLGATFAPMATAEAETVQTTVKLDASQLLGTHLVLVLSYLPDEITSITCQGWTMLGVYSWNHQNDLTIPKGPAAAVMNANKFQGFCRGAQHIVAHTVSGDYVGYLDKGAGNFYGSILTFQPAGKN